MLPKEGESMAVWMARMEWTQDQHEKVIARVPAMETTLEATVARLDTLEPMLVGMNGKLDILLDDKLTRDVRAGDQQKRKLDAGHWIGIAGVLTAVLVALIGLL